MEALGVVVALWLMVGFIGGMILVMDRSWEVALGWALLWPVVVAKKAWRGVRVLTNG